jgi:UDP-D-galactose:(glucosyl)LPS alpha-1,3-D-galactosyltransferase
MVHQMSGSVPTPSKVVVASCCDDAYAQHVTVALASLARRVDPARALEMFVVDCGIAPRNLARIREALGRTAPRATVRIIDAAAARLPRLVAGPTRLHRPAVLMRILLPDLLPPDVERVLYIDADTVTLDDVGPLFDLDLRGQALWAVEDSGAPDEIARLESDPRAPRFPHPRAYFNGGLLLMDLPKWRASFAGPRALDLIETAPDLIRLADQDALNLSFAGDFGVLPRRWNNQIRGDRAFVPEFVARGRLGGVLHWAGRRKPWDRGGRCLRADVYLAELAASGWLGPGALAVLRLTRAWDAALGLARRVRAGGFSQAAPRPAALADPPGLDA